MTKFVEKNLGLRDTSKPLSDHDCVKVLFTVRMLISIFQSYTSITITRPLNLDLSGKGCVFHMRGLGFKSQVYQLVF